MSMTEIDTLALEKGLSVSSMVSLIIPSKYCI